MSFADKHSGYDRKRVCGRRLSSLLRLRGRDGLTGLVLALAVVLGPSGGRPSALAEIGRTVSTDTFLPSNRLDTRGIQRARDLIANGEFSQSIRFLDEILARSEDSFVVDPQGEYYGLKETAREILRTMPPGGGRIYETTFDPVARRLLKQATETGDVESLRQIAQRYFYTPAGHEAALLFAQSEADQGHHLTAALTYEQLLETPEAARRFQPQLSIMAATSWLAANHPARAAELLESLRASGIRSVELSGEDFPLRLPQHGSIDWLVESVGSPVFKNLVAERQWLTTRGNASRNGKTDGGLPHLRVRWRVRLLEHHRLETVHDEMETLRTRQRQPRLLAAAPLAVGDYVITRSPHGLVAIDFRTGKRIWRTQPERSNLLQSLVDGNDQQNENDIEPAQAFAQTLWEDYLYNTTSSDGQRVYVIRDLTPPVSNRAQAILFMQRRNSPSEDRNTNRLCAYDLPTQGKLVWEVDGATRTDQLNGAFFLGAPVAVGQSLYCLAEIESDTAIYLVALDRATGDLQWRQQLVDLEHSIDHDADRRLQASMPAYNEGMLVCPTGSGVVVGVNLAKQALAWAYRYTDPVELSPRQRIMQRHSGVLKQTWVHSTPVIANGKILLTPPESDQLHCLDLMTGKLLWKQPRGDALYLGGVDKDRVLLVGNQVVWALNLADGNSAWTSGPLELPNGSTPTGTGFFNDGQYFLPLSNAQVVAVDVTKGKITSRASSRDGDVLGNLICSRGSVISQTGLHLDCFDQIEALRIESERRRAADPNDVEALRTLGEIAYNDGQLEEAVRLLVQANESDTEDLRTREVLSEALVAALDENFREYRPLLPLLEKIQEPSTKAQLTLMRLQAQGLEELGLADEAFTVCLKAYAELASSEIELTIGRDHQVSAKRWLTAQVATAWNHATSAQRERIIDQFATILAEVRNSADGEVPGQLYECFHALQPSERIGLEIAKDYLDTARPLEAQQVLLDLVESKDSSVRAGAIALSSRVLHEMNMPFLAAKYDRILSTELADVDCLDGQTGAECLSQWAEDTQALSQSWPYGRVEVEVDEMKASARTNRSHIPNTGIYLERCDTILGNCNVTLAGMVSGRNRGLTIKDSLGGQFYEAKIDQSARNIINTQTGVYGVSRGNLLILSLGRQIVAFDTLSATGMPLWRKDTTSNLHYINHQRSVLHGNIGRQRPGRTQHNGDWLGVIGPVTRDSCVIQVEERLVCVDSLTGEVKWSRDNIPLGCDLFGDEDYVFVVPKESEVASVYNTTDGRSLGTAKSTIPAWKERLATVGRQIIRWQRRADLTWELSSVNALDGETLWKFGFEKNSRVDIAQQRFVAVAEPTGRCIVIDIQLGEVVLDQPIQTNVAMSQVHLLAGADNFLIAVQEPPEVAVKPRHVNGFNTTDFTQPLTGQLYLFDRETGKPRWSHPAEVEGLPLMLAQGVDLPIIAFGGTITHRDKRGSKQEIGIMLLEKSTGRLLFRDEQLPPSTHHCSVRASKAEAGEVVVEMISRKIKVKFTDNPRPPEPPAMADVQRNTDDGSKGLKKIGENLWRGL